MTYIAHQSSTFSFSSTLRSPSSRFVSGFQPAVSAVCACAVDVGSSPITFGVKIRITHVPVWNLTVLRKEWLANLSIYWFFGADLSNFSP